MGQAKNRAAEILQLKQNNPFKKILRQIGLFYKDDTDNGFSIVFDERCGMDLNKMAEVIQSSADGYSKHIGLPNCPATKDEMAADLVSQLQDWIPNLNTFLFGSPVRPMKTFSEKEIRWEDSKDEMGAILLFMSSVIWLEANGYIESDNYNGMLYQYQYQLKG